jgi:DNA-binding NarL/FixJ family response regulator
MLQVLIADDHEIMRRGIRSVLESRDDIEVFEAENGKEAIDKTHEFKPHLVILDVSMPVLDGFSAAREIKKAFPEIPILIFSLDRTEAFTEVAKKIGVSGYISKNDVGETLLKAIDAALNNQAFFVSPRS